MCLLLPMPSAKMIGRFLETKQVFQKVIEEFDLEPLDQIEQALLEEVYSVFTTVANAIQHCEGFSLFQSVGEKYVTLATAWPMKMFLLDKLKPATGSSQVWLKILIFRLKKQNWQLPPTSMPSMRFLNGRKPSPSWILASNHLTFFLKIINQKQ